MPSITNRHDFNTAREAINSPNPSVGRKKSFCYLCGNSLPEENHPNRNILVMQEHVFPESICGSPPNGSSDWRPKLEVHASCDSMYKSDSDQFYNSYSNTVTNPSDSWDKSQAMEVRKHLGQMVLLNNGETLGSVGNADSLNSAVWNWVRGIHALLYSTFLPKETQRNITAPVRMFQGVDKPYESQFIDQANTRSICVQINYLASKLSKIHRLKCWGDTIEFVATWVDCNSTLKSKKAHGPMCFWILTTPRVKEWSLTDSSDRIPWAGIYSMRTPPNSINALKHAELTTKQETDIEYQDMVDELLPSIC